MANHERPGEIIETDVLDVGHGAAGPACAITVKQAEARPQVLAVGKACVGFGGKANQGGGHCAFIPEGGGEKYVERHTRHPGDYRNGQDRLRQSAGSTRDILDDVRRWGVIVYGEGQPINAHPMIPWKMTTVDLDCLVHMSAFARPLAVGFLEKIAVVDRLTVDGRAAGAIGFGLLDGKTCIFTAKAVILTNRNRNWRIMRMWNPARGDGIAAAFRAGPSAARYAVAAARLPVDAGEAAALRAEICEKLAHSRGMTTSEMAWRVLNFMHPIKHSAWKHEDRRREALGIVLRLKEKLPALVAAGAHCLSAVNECRSMVLAAEMFYRARLARKESCGWFIREDYPHRDGRSMLKWIVLQKDGGRMRVSYEDVPVARYEYRPEGFSG